MPFLSLILHKLSENITLSVVSHPRVRLASSVRTVQDTLVTELDGQANSVSLPIGRDRTADYVSGFRPSIVAMPASARKSGR